MLNIEKKLDKAFQELSKGKECYRYFRCSNSASEIHHTCRRANKLYRWDRRNALPICRECHIKIHNRNLKEPKLPFEIEDYHQYKVDHCLSDEDFLRMKCEEYGIEYVEETFRKNQKVSKPTSSKMDEVKKPVLSKMETTEIANEYRRKMWKEAYQKKKAFAK